MRFSVSSTALSSKLTALSRVINSKNSLPILGDFVFEISDLENNPIRIIERARSEGQVTRSEGQVIDCFEKSITCPRDLLPVIFGYPTTVTVGRGCFGAY